MKSCLINKITVLIILFSGAVFSFSEAQNSTYLQGQIKKSDGSVLKKEKVFLIQTIAKKTIDSVVSDSNGVFKFEKFPYGLYAVGVNLPDVDNSIADPFSVNPLNPVRNNQHFVIDDGSLVCTEINYKSIKDALENKENVFVLGLNSLQHDVAEKSMVIGSDGSKKLSPKIGEFINLEVLTININGINSLPAEMGKLKKLSQLTASLNKISSLPAEMADLKNLYLLDLGKNNFQLFPDVITTYSGLISLNLESNFFPSIPTSINMLKNLQILNLSNCSELMALPAQIGELTNLVSLDLSKCIKLKSLPDEIIKLKNLKVLDVTGTKISTKKFQEAVPGCEVRK